MLILKQEDFGYSMKIAQFVELLNKRGKKVNGKPFGYNDVYQYFTRERVFDRLETKLPPEYGNHKVAIDKIKGKLHITLLQ